MSIYIAKTTEETTFSCCLDIINETLNENLYIEMQISKQHKESYNVAFITTSELNSCERFWNSVLDSAL